MTIFPVYCFQNGLKVEVFHARTYFAARDFCMNEKWESQPNGFYCAPSRKVS